MHICIKSNSLPVIFSPAVCLCLWFLRKMKCSVDLYWHNLTNKYSTSWVITIKVFFLTPEWGRSIFVLSCTSLSIKMFYASIREESESRGWTPVCQVWSVSIIPLLLLQWDHSYFVSCITFGWSAAFAHQREAVTSLRRRIQLRVLGLMMVTTACVCLYRSFIWDPVSHK